MEIREESLHQGGTSWLYSRKKRWLVRQQPGMREEQGNSMRVDSQRGRTMQVADTW